MKAWKKITRSNFFIKLRNWEYWPFGIIQFPVILYYVWLSIRSRSFLFFSASNPGIDMGGMFGESKFDVLQKIPLQYVPKTILVKSSVKKEQILKILDAEGFSLPVIFKPDLGERGFMVKCIASEKDIEKYLAKIKTDFLIQELVDLPLEFGLFYTRFPTQPDGKITSIVVKEMLYVIGDGHSTIEQLIFAKDRAKLQWKRLLEQYQDKLLEVLPKGKKMELVSIGNHAVGTKFLNGGHLINDKLSMTFDRISKEIPGFYFGRFDLRCASLGDLYEGRVKIVELNGCGAEPAHIYDPEFGLPKSMGVLFDHWRNIFMIARENQKSGISFTRFSKALEFYKKFKKATQ